MKKQFLLALLLGSALFSCSDDVLKDEDNDVDIPEVPDDPDLDDPSFEEYEGVKLLVTYQNSPLVELREPHSDRIDSLYVAENGSKFTNEVGTKVANAIVYGENSVSKIYTGLDRHGDHYHTYEPEVKIITSTPQTDRPDWTDFNGIWRSKENGNLFTTTSEGVINSTPAEEISLSSLPKEGVNTVRIGTGYMDENFFILSNKNNGIVVMHTSTSEVLHTFNDLGEIYSANMFTGEHWSENYGLVSTEKGLLRLLLNRGDDSNISLEYHLIEYPEGSTKFDQLIYRKFQKDFMDPQIKTLLGVDYKHGVFQIDAVEGTITKVIDAEGIKFFEINHMLTDIYVLTENSMTVYDFESFTPNASVKLRGSLDKNVSFGVSEKFAYLHYNQNTHIDRFDAKDLLEYSSIKTEHPIANIGVCGNVVEVPIDNHN
ncbi:hypothetical protein [Sediminitomix flava]|uniref:Lipoprotein n=1 Tax=Sediminitomix flava TaxID=379075 RepID=A0A315YXZ9_SEDFL|nr:hypothetical protein [Sediminitomix flava]PWJ35018.1 hypothetical protein BC781_11059 [Sediminitomix flava]